MIRQKHLLFAVSILFLVSCSDRADFLTEAPSLSVKDSFNLTVTQDTIGKRPVINDSNETPYVTERSKIPVADTNMFYGVDFEGDTIIYTEGKKILTEGTITGNFIKIEKGDYLHLTLKDSIGWYHNFFVLLKNGKKMDALWEEKYPQHMKKIRVHWKRENLYLEEAGGKMLVYFIDDLKILN